MVRFRSPSNDAVGIFVGALILVGLALLTMRQNHVWRSDEALWATSQTVRAHANRHDAFYAAGKWREAIQECEWLRHASDAGMTTPQQADDIRRVCPVRR